MGLTNLQWARLVYMGAGEAIPGLSIAGRILLVSHAAYESGWGRQATAARVANNIFNITAGPAWSGDTFRQKDADWEYYKGTGTPPTAATPWSQDSAGRWRRRIDQVWRKYATYRDALVDYWGFLGPGQNRGRYVFARAALEAGNPVLFANELYKAGYFTLPPTTYASAVASIFSTVSTMLDA